MLRASITPLLTRVPLKLLLRQLHQGQSLYDSTIYKVFVDYLRDVFRRDLAVHRAVRIDHHGGTDRAETDRTAFGKHDLAHRVTTLRFLALADALFLKNVGEFGHYFPSADLRTGFSSANENLPLYRRLKHRGELFKLLAVFNKLLYGH